jgi:hypothetical protein
MTLSIEVEPLVDTEPSSDAASVLPALPVSPAAVVLPDTLVPFAPAEEHPAKDAAMQSAIASAIPFSAILLIFFIYILLPFESLIVSSGSI